MDQTPDLSRKRLWGIPSGDDIHSLPWKDPPFLRTVNPNKPWAIVTMAMSSYQTKLREQKTKLGDKAAAAGKAGDHEGRQVLGVNQDPLNIKGRTPIGLIVNVILGKMSEIKEPARKLWLKPANQPPCWAEQPRCVPPLVGATPWCCSHLTGLHTALRPAGASCAHVSPEIQPPFRMLRGLPTAIPIVNPHSK